MDLEEYRKSEALQFPIQHPDKNISIAEFNLICITCNNVTDDVRGDVREYSECFDIRAACICDRCNSLMNMRIRVYEDRYLIWTKDGFQTFYSQPLKISLWNKIINLCKSVMGR